MADFDQNGNIIRDREDAPDNLDGARTWAHVMYGLHGLSALSGILTSATIAGAFVFGWPSIIAVIINYVTRSQVRDTWLDSHWRWQLRTFWFAALWLLVSGMLAMTFIGIPAAIVMIVVTGIWVLYRVIRGWLGLVDKRTMPVPV